MSRSTTLRLGIVCVLLATLLLVQAAVAQHTEPDCNLEELIDHQHEHAQELADFELQAETDFDAALATLYRTAISYQALALDCGFDDGAEVEATHEAEHAEDPEHDEHDEVDMLEIAHSVGDPEEGEILFNTFRPEVSFACATCHRVDSKEQLVGPGLLGVSSPAHDHSAQDTMSDMPGMAETEEADGHHDNSTAEATAEHDEHGAAERTTEEMIAYLRASIVDPSANLMTGFPDDLMPKIYSEIFSEEEINNLIAYLLTL